VHKRSRLLANLLQAVLATALVVGFVVVLVWQQGASEGTDEAASRRSEPEPRPTAAVALAPRVVIEEDRGRLLVGPRTTLRRKPKPTHRTIPGMSFRVASFNVLGHRHTQPGGQHAGMPDSARRMGGAVAAWRRHGVDVVGTQEMQPENIRAFHHHGGGTFAIWPGSSQGRKEGANSVVWRRSTFAFIEGRFLTIPYLDGQPFPMPYVKLRHLATDREIWVASVHNPADKGRPGFHGRMRGVALGNEVALANSLGADGTPVFLTGDFNDRAPAFCRITTGTALQAANGGSTGAGCAPPGRMDVDWVFGPDSVSFGGFGSLRMPGVSDHPLVVATATVPQRRERIPGR